MHPYSERADNMCHAVIFFRAKDGFLNAAAVNEAVDALCGAHFSPTTIVFLPCDDRKEFSDRFASLLNSSDDILVFDSENNRFELSDAVEGYDRLNYVYENGRKSVLFIADNQKKLTVLEEIWIPHLQKKYDTSYGKVTFKVFGLKREEILKTVDPISEECGVEFVVYGDNLDYKVQLVYDNRSTKMDYDRAQKAFILALKDSIYAEYDVSLHQRLVDLLKLRRCVLSIAESFTGGRLASSVVSVPGASEVFYDGVVSYDSDAKVRLLGVDTSTLAKYKPVSAQVACEMAKGLFAEGKANVVLSTTGIAGPTSDDSGFPVGLCYIGVGFAGKVKAYRFQFEGSREEIIEKGTKTALFLAVMTLKEI